MTTEATSRTPELQELLRAAIDYSLRDVHVALPGRIEKYDKATQKADVKPLVQRLVATENGEELLESLPVLPGVPVVFPRGGTFYISMPVKKGDHCLLVFNSFPIDKYKAGNGKDASPEDFSMHDLSDGVALMGFAPFKKAIKDADGDNIVIGEEQGVQIHVASDKIELGEKGAGEKVSIDSKLQAELDKIKTELDKLNAHEHVVTAACTAGGIAGPTPTTGGPSISYSKGSTESSLVTIKE